jgi:hypothetical protein
MLLVLIVARKWVALNIVIHQQEDLCVQTVNILPAIVPVMPSWTYKESVVAVFGKVGF